MLTSRDDIVATTKAWLENAVIGLNLCPFAKAVFVKEQIRYVVTEATDQQALLDVLEAELKSLNAADSEKIDTTLIIHPYVLQDFLSYNDFLSVANNLIHTMGLEGNIQIASFHPMYQFAGTNAGDIENYTNRSPYPLLHLLREESIDRAVHAFPDAESIYEKNMETMRRLGLEGWRKLAQQK